MASITLDADRRLRAELGQVRGAIVEALRRSGFRVATEMATVVEADRGSVARSAMLMPGEVPLGVRVTLASAPEEPQITLISVHLTDRSISVVALGIQAPYVSAFQGVLLALDQAMAQLDPAAGTGFPEPRWWAGRPQADQLSRHHEAAQRFVGVAASRVSDKLSGGAGPKGPSLWGGIDQLVLTSSAGAVAMDMGTARSLLAIPVLISRDPGSLVGELAFSVGRLAAAIEGRLNAGAIGTVALPVPEDDREAFEFLHRQLGIRNRLPVRTLCTCRDCRQTKVVNLDLKRLRERSRRVKMITSALVAARGSGEPSPFKIFGAVFGQSKLDPDFVCTRCESTAADETPVTFCPGCGDMRKEAVLTRCSECGFDFDELAPGGPVWSAAVQDAVPPPVPPYAPLPPSAPAPAGFGPPPAGYGGPRPQCAVCGSNYPTLWAIQVFDGGLHRSLTVCATSPRCSPPSLVPPVRVPG